MLLTVVTPTHDPKYLQEIWHSLEAQTLEHRWEWLITPTRACAPAVLALPFAKSPRVRVVPYPGIPGNVGAAKLWAFSRACIEGADQVLVELDHDDLLHPHALELVEHTFLRLPEVGFVYSDSIDWSPTSALVTYHHPERNRAWQEEGWRFSVSEPLEMSAGLPYCQAHDYPLSFEPSAAAVSSILYAPNHLRAWRRDVYQAVGGHDPSRKVCDDAELLIRTYLATRMHRIAEPLYFYRVDGANTWLANQATIAEESFKLKREHLHTLVVREMGLRGLPCLDLGGGIDPAPPPWISVDNRFSEDFTTNVRNIVDLMQFPWPFEDSSVGAFRAFDLLEHLPDRLHTMREIYRCLAPGGWLLSKTPSCAGPGAYRDPTHVSLWVKDSFRYYTERGLARYLPPARSGENPRFMVGVLDETADELPYITADLVSLKADDGRLPGRRGI